MTEHEIKRVFKLLDLINMEDRQKFIELAYEENDLPSYTDVPNEIIDTTIDTISDNQSN